MIKVLHDQEHAQAFGLYCSDQLLIAWWELEVEECASLPT